MKRTRKEYTTPEQANIKTKFSCFISNYTSLLITNFVYFYIMMRFGENMASDAVFMISLGIFNIISILESIRNGRKCPI